MADFDTDDKNSWYLGLLTREESNSILQNERDSGVFLIRDSNTIRGDFVLCVKEDSKNSHYIINRIQTGGVTRFRIGEQEFSSLPALLNFYKTHYLDTTSLIRPPLNRPKYVAKYAFEGRDPDDLPFQRGEVLTLVRKDEEKWWTVKNQYGRTGLVPVPYIDQYDAEAAARITQHVTSYPSPTVLPTVVSSPPSVPHNGQSPRKLPAWAQVIKKRIPNAYDNSQIPLQIGEEILVTAMHISGQWEGELKNGAKGFFPFTHIQWIDDDGGQD